MIRSGWAAKFILLPDGGRQILDIMLPGDMVSTDELLLQTWTSSVCSLTNVEICSFESTALLAGVESRPEGVLPLIAMCTDYIVRLRDLVAALGRKDAEARMAGLVLSLHRRLTGIGHKAEASVPFPLRQQDLADLLGLTQVHISRVLRSMREKGIFEIDADEIRILDFPALRRVSQGRVPTDGVRAEGGYGF